MTSNGEFRDLIDKAKEDHGMVMISHDGVMQEEKRKDKIRKDDINIINDSSGDKSPDKPPKKSIPVQQVVDLYHEILPELPSVQLITSKRKSQIQQRWNEGSLPSLDVWRDYFETVRESDFLIGRGKPNPNTGKIWKADLEWLTNQTNFAKVWEGKYHE